MLHLCVRRTLAWHDEAAVAANLLPKMRPVVERWNATFDLSYAGFRLRLAEIARRSLGRVENAKLAPLEDVPPGALLVPVDDDDWLSPELANRVLAEAEPLCTGYHWSRYILETPRRPRRCPWRRVRPAADTSQFTCASNNYAVRRLPELSESISNHVAASVYFDANPGHVKHVAGSLSVQNRNLSSQTVLRHRHQPLGRDALVETYERHRKLYRRLRLPPEVAWAEPYVAAMAELMHAIRLR
jgi:hypothetical protein